MCIEAGYLRKRTQEYWRISSIRYGRIETTPVLTTGDALLQAVDIIQHLGPNRRLKDSVRKLYFDIVENRRSKKRAKTNVVALRV